MSRIILSTMTVIVFLASVPQSAWCAESDAHSDFRVGAFAGIFIPNSATWNASGLLNGLPFAASGDISLKTGTAFGGFVGHSFSDYFNIDLLAGYASSSFDKFDGTVSIAGLGTSTGSMAVNGRVHAIMGFMNFLVTPFGTQNQVTPYFGVGPGFTHATAKLRSFNAGSVALPVDSTSTETAFAANITLGFDVKLAPTWELGIGGEYVWINAKHLGSGSGIQANTGAVSGEIIGAVLEHRF